jgi:type III restriction enzyme
VKAYVKNQGLGLEVPYRMQDTVRTYIPDFITVVNDGNGTDDPLHLVIETKGYRGEDAVEKATTMNSYWIPGVNNLNEFGRWAFLELTSGETMAQEFQRFVEDANNKNTASPGSEQKDFSKMDFKELLASAPLEGVELERTEALPREVEL